MAVVEMGGTTMRCGRIAVVVTGLLIGLPAGADMPASAPLPIDDRVALNYQIYFGGLNVMQLAVDVGVASDAYDVRARVQTVGLAGFLAPWTSVAVSEGSIDDGRIEPRLHRVRGEWRGRERTIDIDFDDDGEVTTVALYPQPGNGPNDQVPVELRQGAIDPPSALFSLTRLMAQEGRCQGRMRVFDGRRRYDVVLTDRGRDTLIANDYSAYHGVAIRCDFHFEPIVSEYVSQPDKKRRFRSGRAWFAELFPGRPVVPVRLEIDGDYAQTLVHLHQMPRLAAGN
jgi:hypothetical protein